MIFFFFQAEDGIRDHCVTGVQTCALPISFREREKIKNLLALAKGIHQRGPPCAHVAEQKSEQRRVILKSRQFRKNDAQILGAFRDLYPGELLDAERIGPVICHRTKIIEPIGVRHRAEVARVLADLFVITMQIAEDRLELAHDLAFEGDVHAKYAVGRWMLRSHRHFEQLAVQSRAHCCRRPLSWFEGLDSRAHANGNVKKVKTVTSLNGNTAS